MPRAKQQINTTEAIGRCRFRTLIILLKESEIIISGRLGTSLESEERLLICSICVNSPLSRRNRHAHKIAKRLIRRRASSIKQPSRRAKNKPIQNSEQFKNSSFLAANKIKAAK